MANTQFAGSTRPIVPLLMCGGAGTRLWPVSREARPKQFIRLFGQRSTFQDTVLRVTAAGTFGRPIVVANAAYRFIVQEQLKEIDVEADILLEPVRRDSGPGLAAGATFAAAKDPDAIVVAVAADHVITDSPAFRESCRVAADVAKTGYITTFGIAPDRPAVEYGYIKRGEALGNSAFKVDRFVEKPNLETATKYVEEGYLWNSGNFVFTADKLLGEYRKNEPASADAVSAAVRNAEKDLDFIALDADAFSKARAVSIDYAVLERTMDAAVVPVSHDWSDVGSWRAVWELSQKDEDGNVTQGDVIFEGARNCNVISNKTLVAVDGVDDLTIVVTEDAVLVSNQKDPVRFKRLVSKLKQAAPRITDDHIKVNRPWGSYQSLDLDLRHQVKRIVVKPGARLSLQRHFHRSEHWIVVRGAALVTVNDQVKTVHENESCYIPIGATHRLENPGKIPLELIEVQTGSYLGEDDIVRIEDDYRRV
jgi:mannose-1-phosphate guanylyltransferase/mannose-6-phosphate isomerase